MFVIFRTVAFGAIVAAVVAQFVHSFAIVPDIGFFVVNFLSYFTIQSNLIGAAMLALCVWRQLRKTPDAHGFMLFRASATAYLATTLVVYNLLLRGIQLDQGTTVPWSNEILHLWAPLYVLLDWVLTRHRVRLAWNRLWVIAVYPIIWAIYTMIRGPLVSWYPYPFLNPDTTPGGYGGVSIYIVAIAAFILLMGAFTFWVTRRAPLASLPVVETGQSHTP